MNLPLKPSLKMKLFFLEKELRRKEEEKTKPMNRFKLWLIEFIAKKEFKKLIKENNMNFLQGKKTYLAAVFQITYAVSALFIGNLDPNEAVRIVMEAITFITLRAGIKTDSSK